MWLDNTLAYWITGFAAATATVAFAVLPATTFDRSRASRFAFIASIFVTLLAGRWQMLAVSRSLEFDETFHVTAAMTAAVHPVPWLSFDPDTAGPLNVYLLDLPRLLGMPVSFAATHAIALLLLAGILTCLYLFASEFVGELAARLAVLPALAFLAFTTNLEFLHYASEIPSIFFLMLALVFAAVSRSRPNAVVSAAFASGLALGATPFAKLQSAPLAAAIALGMIAIIFAYGEYRRVPAYAAFVAGLVAIPAVLLGVVTAKGGFGDFFVSYLEMPFAYVAGGELQPLSFIIREPHYARFVDVTLAVAVLALAVGLVRRRPTVALRSFQLAAAAVVLCAAGLVAVFQPHRPWTHYVFYLIPGLVLVLAAALEPFIRSLGGSRSRLAGAVSVAVLSVLPIATQTIHEVHPYLGQVAENPGPPPPDLIGKVLLEILHPGDRLAVWGFNQDLYPATGALLGTRDVNPTFAMVPSRLTPYYQARYARDLAERKPRAFVDAVAPGALVYTDRKTAGFETVPAIAAVVRANYHLICDLAGQRVYELNDGARGQQSKPFTDCPGSPDRHALGPAALSAYRIDSHAPAIGAIDNITPGPGRIPLGTNVTLNGWAVDPLQLPGTSLLVIVDGRIRRDVTSSYGLLRPDVGAALHKPQADYTGFAGLVIPSTLLPRGKHIIRLGVAQRDGKRVYVLPQVVSVEVH